MADLGGTFDPGAVSDDREVLPAGEVLAQIFESDLKVTGSGSGQYLKLGWEIIDGAFKGRKLWSNVNVQNSNAQAQEIGQRELKRICEAAGVGPIRNSEELHFKPLLISIIVAPPHVGKDGKSYGESNEIKGYKFYGPLGSAPAPSAPTGGAPAAQAAPAAAPATGKVPWPTR